MSQSRLGKIPWWGRFETRVIVALVLLGVLSVGASTYLVQLTVSYFQNRLSSTLVQGEQAVDTATPFYRALVEAEVAAFEARAQVMALQLTRSSAWVEADARRELHALLAAESDVVRISLVSRQGTRIIVGSPAPTTETFRATRELEPPAGIAAQTLEVEFAIDTELARHYQRLGQRKRSLALQKSQQGELEQAVYRAVGIASALVLVISLIAGWLVARPMTRKVSQLSEVMARVGTGELDVRAEPMGRDELGELAAAFNRMLDELAVAQRKVAYLQRIGAWQEMARRIAHEIKNPLTPIQLAIQQLRDKDPGLDAEFSQLLRNSAEIIEDEIGGLRRMVQTFSRFAKVPEVRREPVPILRVLQEFERAYGHLTEREDDVLVIEHPDPSIEVLADRQLLKQALVNLVENAVLSGREAGVEAVRVEVSVVIESQSVFLVVDDNGPGIAAERRERVFEPYETGRPDGSGLGLTIVKKIVLDHGGEITIEDSPLGGARMVLRLVRTSARPKLQTQ